MSLGPPLVKPTTVNGYRVISVPAVVRLANGEPIGRVILQYGRRISDTEDTVERVELFLLLGVLAGSALAFLAGMAIARRAMAPIAELTLTAAEIARTRDPSRRVPQPEATRLPSGEKAMAVQYSGIRSRSWPRSIRSR